MSDFSDKLDEIMVAMLVIPHTGGEIYKHSPEKFRQAKEQIIKLFENTIGEVSEKHDYIEVGRFEDDLRKTLRG